MHPASPKLRPTAPILTFWSADTAGEDPTPLRVAAGEGQVEVVRMLVEAGALGSEPADRQSLLAFVVSKLTFEPSPALLKTLATLSELGAEPGRHEDPPIVAVTQRASAPAVLRPLLDHGADPDQRRADGTPVLVLAARHGDHAAVDRLLQAGADVNATDQGGRTALMHAVERNLSTVAATLLLGGADPDRVSADGMTALRLAQGWQWQNIQFALGERSVGQDKRPDSPARYSAWPRTNCDRSPTRQCSSSWPTPSRRWSPTSTTNGRNAPAPRPKRRWPSRPASAPTRRPYPTRPGAL